VILASYLDESVNYYLKRLEDLQISHEEDSIALAMAKTVSGKLTDSRISAPIPWMKLRIVARPTVNEWKLVCPSVTLAVLKIFERKFVDILYILLSFKSFPLFLLLPSLFFNK